MRVLIVDDEPRARWGLRQLLQEHSSIDICGEANSAETGIVLAEKLRPDLVFLDVAMPRLDGFSLIKGLTYAPKIVFVSAHSRPAIDAFDVGAVDYLLKPVNAERLAQALAKVEKTSPDTRTKTSQKEKVRFGTSSGEIFVNVNHINALIADGDFCWLRRSGEPPILVTKLLKHYETILPENSFCRLDRSLLVRLSAVKRWTRSDRSSGLLWLEGDDTPLPLGRTALERLRLAT